MFAKSSEEISNKLLGIPTATIAVGSNGLANTLK